MTLEPGDADNTGQHVHYAAVDGQHFAVRPRPDEPGVYDFDWLSGPRDYGFTSARSDGSAMSHAEMEEAIRNFLAQIDHHTGYIP
ncbi:hypothetical protein [Candidatus Protofrankia californiensis]|uniref:hypothetical protein n=1 Tax=Candidatus Protofrankia californiensis TaxID=1839754 RepID=UPI0019D0DF43|nr:hypothetical protein [Candidatus Protofrankia californiensis]